MKKKTLFFCTFSVLLFIVTFGLLAHTLNDFKLVCGDSAIDPKIYAFNYAYQEIDVDSYRIKLYFYDSTGTVIETEIFSGDEFTGADGWTQSEYVGQIPSNCEYYQGKLRVTLTDGTIYRNIWSNKRYGPF